ncbi:MAG: hypothetical protein A2X23_12600 [Chloroflexi bacterium GWC2_73_18]|nr:MAG: hypothetical protein A2X23_12600 [Chloroflexi bacterium GWC2_73_18]
MSAGNDGGGPRGPSRRRLLALAAVVVVAVVVAGVVATTPRGPGGPTPSPSPTPGATGSPGPVGVPDLPPLAPDGEIREADLAHDSRDDLYRTPFGAVPAGTAVTLRLRAAAGDLTSATVRAYDALANVQVLVPMTVAASDRTAGEHGFDYWEATLHTAKTPTILYYRFIVKDGPATRYVEDDPALDGGPGRVYGESADASWQIDLYDGDFATPAWARGAVAYQVFPDRFFNGDPSNDPSPDAQPGTEGAARYRYGDVYGNPILVKGWDERPEGYCRAYQGVACDEGPLGRDFFGGDLAGITAKLDTLADLGVTILYLNPIFAAPSNHRYDTSDYTVVDPDLGSQADFEALVAAAKARGIRVILDGVFNHTSSDSPFFDRAGRFAEVGACESADSPYADWYTLKGGPPVKCWGGQSYEDWFGFDTLPVLTESPEVAAYFLGPDGIARRWLRADAAGWRLDVMNEMSHPLLRRLRAAVKETDPDALIIGEEWGDTSAWLLGSEADTTMNYRFRRAGIGLINGDTADPDGAIGGLTPSAFASAMEGVREDYPAPAFAVLLNLVDSHDTSRILWTLTPGRDDPAVKESPAALAEGKAKLRLLATLQLTWPGIASIYYGDEVGLSGHDDPDDRRPYPWGAEDGALREHYRALAHLRADHEALREGDLRFLLADDAAGTLAFGRRTEAEAAVTVLNLATEERTVAIDVGGYLPDGTALADGLGGAATTVSDGRISLSLPAHGSAVLVTAPGTDLAPPAAPTGLAANAGPGSVRLTWEAADGAASYRVWRSLVSGGGYAAVGETSGAGFTDTSPRNGMRYFYAVTALDAAGNGSARSDEVSALPAFAIADARLDGPAAIEHPLSATGPGAPVAGLVTVEGYTAAAGPTVGLRAQVGFGPAGSDPAKNPGWSWGEMSFDSDVGGADRMAGRLRPEELGTFDVAMRVSASGGAGWTYADLDGTANGYGAAQAVRLTAVAGADREPPPAPRNPVLSVVTAASMTLVWDPVASADLYRYEVWRSETAGGPYDRVGTATEPTFTDDTVAAGARYVYAVTAQDTAFNRSGYSPEVATTAEDRQVGVTFTVTLPAYTPPGDTIYIAGDFQGWDPDKTAMTRLDATTWTITLTFTEGEAPQYKYTRGSWEAVEKGPGCEEIPNRTLTVVFGLEGTQRLDDEVGKWRDIDQCG